jgi:hypothetical protein
MGSKIFPRVVAVKAMDSIHWHTNFRKVHTDYWINSTSVKGVRSIRIRLFTDSYQLAERWHKVIRKYLMDGSYQFYHKNVECNSYPHSQYLTNHPYFAVRILYHATKERIPTPRHNKFYISTTTGSYGLRQILFKHTYGWTVTLWKLHITWTSKRKINWKHSTVV